MKEFFKIIGAASIGLFLMDCLIEGLLFNISRIISLF